MNPTELQKTLETLRAELNSAESVDEATRAKLVALAEDIQRLAEKKTVDKVEPPMPQVQDVTEQVQDLLLKFEADHPQLTTALNQVSAALANLGI